ncbi:MAG: DNA polymerase III subunit delta [Rickettsiales bacterium]|jgi:DNA polymerase-3 subunit delta|nr:DNA polymerase III subunit delta [Rickettsiales bacterium]
MKWKEGDLKTAISNAMKGIRAVLFYGPDAGQADELADRVIAGLSVTSDGIFAIAASELREKSDALFAEACTPSLLGGRRIVMITNAGDGAADTVRELVTHPSLDAFVIIIANELRAGGGMRSLFEDASDMAAVPCYLDDEAALGKIIRDTCVAAKIRAIDNDAMQYMFANMGSDRGITRSFLQKLILYIDGRDKITLDDVEKCLPDTGAASLDDFMYSLTAGHAAAAMRALDRLYSDGDTVAATIMIIRGLMRHFKALMAAVCDGVMPRMLFYKVADKFRAAMKIWSPDEISNALARITELEKQTRTTGLNAELMVRDFALKLSARAIKLAAAAKRK